MNTLWYKQWCKEHNNNWLQIQCHICGSVGNLEWFLGHLRHCFAHSPKKLFSWLIIPSFRIHFAYLYKSTGMMHVSTMNLLDAGFRTPGRCLAILTNWKKALLIPSSTTLIASRSPLHQNSKHLARYLEAQHLPPAGHHPYQLFLSCSQNKNKKQNKTKKNTAHIEVCSTKFPHQTNLCFQSFYSGG